jgi:hypothetical protein
MNSLVRIKKVNAGVDVTAVAVNNSVSWDITLYNPLKVNRHFGGIYRLHLQGLRVKQRNSIKHVLLVAYFMLIPRLAYL